MHRRRSFSWITMHAPRSVRTAALLAIICTVFMLRAEPLAAQSPSWLRATGIGNQYAVDYGIATQIDSEGNTYIAMKFFDTLHFGSIVVPGRGGIEIFLAKLDRTGSVLWWQLAGGTGDDLVSDLALGRDGSLYITASVSGLSLRFGDSLLPIQSAGAGDMAVAKYTPDGRLIWVSVFGGPRWDAASSVAGLDDGGCIVGGEFSGRLENAGDIPLLSSGAADGIVMRLDGNGAPVWVRRIGGGRDDKVISVGVDDSGDVYAAGMFSSPSIGLDLTTVTGSGQSGQPAAFVASFDGNGNTRFLMSPGNGGYNFITDMAIDPTGLLYVSGFHYSILAFGDYSLPGHDYPCGYVASYFKTGALRWARQYCSDSGTTIYGIAAERSLALDGGESVYATGSFAGRMRIGESILASHGAHDLFVAHLGDGSAIEWMSSGGGAVNDWGYRLAIDGRGGCAVIGTFSGGHEVGTEADAVFGGHTIRSRGANDVVIAWIGVAAVVDLLSGRNNTRLALEPNPTRDRTWLNVELEHRSSFRLEIVDILGAMHTVAMERMMEAGAHRVPVETSDLAPGLYFCRITIDGEPLKTVPVVVE